MTWVLREVVPISAPSEPVSLADMKDSLRIAHDADDYLLTEYISAARDWLEVETEQIWVSKAYLWVRSTAPVGDIICPPVWPLQAVTEITYYDADNVLQTVDDTTYEVDILSRPGRIRLLSGVAWPVVYDDRLDAFSVAFTAGYSLTGEPVPLRYTQLLRLAVADLYEHREANIEARLSENKAFQRLLWASKYVTFV